MENENVESQDLQETTEEVTPSTEEVTTEATTEETVDWEAKAKQLEAQNKQLYARAKKAEAAPKAQPSNDLTGKDILALSSAGVTDEDDIEIVQKAAKLQGISVAEALKDSVVKGILKGKQEERTTATASSTSPRRAPAERSGRDLLDQASKGNLPDEKDLRKLVRARIGIDK